MGSVVFVTGEPGIGKTALATRFIDDLDGGTRALVGACDDLSIPRPLGPFRDFASSVSGELASALSTGAASHEIQTLLIAELKRPPHPTVLILEDVQWADDATLDAVTVLGRRISSLPALLVLTYRPGEVPPGHPLLATVAAVAPEDSVFLELEPLSESAVASLIGERANEVYATTRGNPFYVTELVGARAPAGLPPTVTTAVLARASRLDENARRLVELVSVVPGRIATPMLDAVMPNWSAAAAEPERRQLLEVEPRHVRFRHELARHAIRSSIPIAGRRRLHMEILGVLLATDADPADTVHHAEAAGAEDVVAEYALVAARRAAALESNREAFSHYRRAADFVDRLPAGEQGIVLEEVATAGYLVGRLTDAFNAIKRAIAVYRELGDGTGVGRCERILSRLHWIAGDGANARKAAFEAVAILEPLGPSRELARAYSTVSQLEMLAEDIDATLLWGTRALDLATELADEQTRAHALVNIGTARLNSEGTTETLLEAHAVAEASGDRHEAARALDNLGYSLFGWVQAEGVAPIRGAGSRVRHRARALHHRVVRCGRRRLAPAESRRVERGRTVHQTGDRERRGRAADREDGPRRAGRPAWRSRCVRAARRDRRRSGSHGRASADRPRCRARAREGADRRGPDADRTAGAADRADPSPWQPRLPVRDARRGLGGGRGDRGRDRHADVTAPCRHGPA